MANPHPKTDHLPKIQKGTTLNPGGSSKGYRKTLQGDFLRQLANDFKTHGKSAIVAAREHDPMGYVRTVAALLPKEVELLRPLEGLSDDELTAIAEQLRSALSAASLRSGDSVAPQLSQTH